MDKKKVLDLLKEINEKSTKRNFSQSYDLIFNLKGINVKSDEQKIDSFFTLPHFAGKKGFVCAFVDNELLKQSKEVCDKTIFKDEFAQWGKDKKAMKKLAAECDYFIAQANLMGQIASAFGKVLGPRGKMPNPKVGAVVPGTAQLRPIFERLQKTVRLQTKNEATLKVKIGDEKQKEEELADNIVAVYNHVISILPQGDNNIKNIMLKKTMGQPFILGAK